MACLPRYGSRVLFVVLLGLLTAVWSNWSDSVWFFHPWQHSLGITLERVVTALLIGLVLAAFVKPVETS